MVTVEDFRRQIYEKYPGIQPMMVTRHSNYTMQIISQYKHPRFNMLMEPSVTFMGEYGADGGALTKEYFWTAMLELRNGKYMDKFPIFVGEEDHKLPNSDGVLLRSGVFDYIGKFMLHSLLHTGVAFVGLSKAVMHYIFNPNVGMEPGLELELCQEDVPDPEVREVLEYVSRAPCNFS